MTCAVTYQRLHESLVDPKAAAGRRLLFEASRSQRFPHLGSTGWDEINYSLALFDTLAGYTARGEVEERVVLEALHHPLANIAGPVREFMAYRESQSIYQPWGASAESATQGRGCGARKPGLGLWPGVSLIWITRLVGSDTR